MGRRRKPGHHSRVVRPGNNSGPAQAFRFSRPGSTMDLTIISTYRCNSKCQMCYIWKNPTDPREEVSLETLSKLPDGFDNLNVSGGEPTLRRDLGELVELLYPKARILEI